MMILRAGVGLAPYCKTNRGVLPGCAEAPGFGVACGITTGGDPQPPGFGVATGTGAVLEGVAASGFRCPLVKRK